MHVLSSNPAMKKGYCMVSVIKVVNGAIEAQQPVSNGIISDPEKRRIEGLHRGQEVIRGMEWALRSAGVSFYNEAYDTSLVLNNGSSFRIAMRESMDSPWLAWSNGDWSDPIC